MDGLNGTRLPALSAEMREVHRRLRAALDLARESAELEEEADPLLGDPLLYCWSFCLALSGHHLAEDRALFPRLIAVNPAIEPVIRQLTQDHHMIDYLINDFRRATARGVSTEEKLRHLDGIEAVMLTHFRYEEKRLLPLLDDLGEPILTPVEVFGPLA